VPPSKRRGPISAEDAIASVKSDLVYRRRMQERDRVLSVLRAALAKKDQAAVRRLAARGVHVTSIEELGRQVPLSGQAIGVLRELLSESMSETSSEATRRFQEAIVATLGHATVPMSAGELTRLFDLSTDENLRWTIANTLAEAETDAPEEWLVERVKEASSGRGREMLVLAVARRLQRDRALPVVRSVFPSLAPLAALALGEIGTEEDLAFLKVAGDEQGEAWVRREIKKAIAKIERRLKREAAREVKKPGSRRNQSIR
jgi:hypothetical protein